MFKVNIKATNIKLTEETGSYIKKKLDSILKLIGDEDTEALFEVEIGQTTRHHKSGDIFRAEIRLNVDGKTFYASSEKDALFTAIDDVKNEIKNRVSSYKTKKETLFKRGGKKIKKLMKGLKRLSDN